jgi:hypothetical protein
MKRIAASSRWLVVSTTASNKARRNRHAWKNVSRGPGSRLGAASTLSIGSHAFGGIRLVEAAPAPRNGRSALYAGRGLLARLTARFTCALVAHMLGRTAAGSTASSRARRDRVLWAERVGVAVRRGDRHTGVFLFELGFVSFHASDVPDQAPANADQAVALTPP